MTRLLRSVAFIGILFACLFSGQSAARDLPVTLECSAYYYASGDSVYFTWTNDTDSTLTAANHPPFDIFDASTGEMVCMVAIPWEYSLPPHCYVTLAWDQINCDQDLVSPGPYVVRIYYVFNDQPPGYVVEDRFVIRDVASIPDGDPVERLVSWGEVKSIYR